MNWLHYQVMAVFCPSPNYEATIFIWLAMFLDARRTLLVIMAESSLKHGLAHGASWWKSRTRGEPWPSVAAGDRHKLTDAFCSRAVSSDDAVPEATNGRYKQRLWMSGLAPLTA